MDIFNFALKYWVEFAFGLVAGGITLWTKRTNDRQKAQEAKQKAIEGGMVALLRDRIVRSYNFFKETGYCPIYSLESTEELYKRYHELGGNGTITRLYEEIKTLPTEKPKKSKTKKAKTK